jgi:hypothetical protein
MVILLFTTTWVATSAFAYLVGAERWIEFGAIGAFASLWLLAVLTTMQMVGQ